MPAVASQNSCRKNDRSTKEDIYNSCWIPSSTFSEIPTHEKWIHLFGQSGASHAIMGWSGSSGIL